MKTLNRIHVPGGYQNQRTGVYPCVLNRRALAVGEALVDVDGLGWYVRYSLGLRGPHGGQQKAGICQPVTFDGASVIDARSELDWPAGLMPRIDQAMRALDRPEAEQMEELTFLHPLKPIELRRGSAYGRPFHPVYKDAPAAQADGRQPWHGHGLALASNLTRVLADELLVHIPAARRRWTSYSDSVFGSGSPRQLMDLMVCHCREAGKPVRAVPA